MMKPVDEELQNCQSLRVKVTEAMKTFTSIRKISDPGLKIQVSVLYLSGNIKKPYRSNNRLQKF